MLVILNVHNAQGQLIIVQVVLQVLLYTKDRASQVVHPLLLLTMANAVLAMIHVTRAIQFIQTAHPVIQIVHTLISSTTNASINALNIIMKMLLMEYA